MKLDFESAKNEFDKWLDFKNVKERKRESNAEFGKTVIEAIEDGQIEFNENFDLIFTLNAAVESETSKIVLDKLTFKPRLRVQELNAKLKGVAATDGDGRVMAYIAALTNQNTGLLAKMYTDDYTVCQSIVMYFL